MALDPNINTLEKAKFVEYLGETCLRVLVVNQATKNFGRENVLIGQDYVTIVFDKVMSNSNYTELISIESDDFSPIFFNHITKNKTVNGMTIQLNAPVDTPNYFVNWAVLES